MLLPNTAFRLRQLVRAQPVLCSAIAISIMLFAGVVLTLLEIRRATAEVRLQVAALRVAAISRPIPVADQTVVVGVSLLPFNSAEMVQVFNNVADKTGVPMNEVSFTLDEGNARPFMRYRASFSVNANYLAIRRFIDSVHEELRDVSLDSIACYRAAADAQPPKCDMVLSGFFAKDARG